MLACNFINSTNQEPDALEANQNELQEEQNQSQVEQDQGQMVQGQFPGQDDQWYLISHGGMEFWYDPKVILDIEASTIPWSEGGAYEEPHPAYIQYSLLLDNGVISVIGIETTGKLSTMVKTAVAKQL